MKRVFFFFTLSLIAGLFFINQDLYAKKFNFTYSIFFPASHDQYKTAAAWAKEVEKKTGGKVHIVMFPGGTLTKAKNCFDGVVKGISDIGMSCFAYTRGRFPVMEAADLPLGYPDGVTASKTVNDFYLHTKPKELSKVKVLYIHGHGPGLLHTINPVKNLDDFNKMKIRSTGLSAKVVESLGGVPVAMSQGSTYEALRKGVVEGSFGPMEVLKGWRQGEVIKYTADTSFIGYTTSMFVIMNKKKWNALPDDIKKVMDDLSSVWVEKHGKAWDSGDLAAKKYSLERGNKIISLSDNEKIRWQKKVSSVINDYIKTASEKGVDAKSNVDYLKSKIKEFSMQ